MIRAALSLGANLGDRVGALDRARDVLAAQPDLVVRSTSSLYETDPVGGVDQPDFVNAVVLLDAGTAAQDGLQVARLLLAVAQSIESELNRIREVRWGPRTIDVDILAVGTVQHHDPELSVPHPRIAERAFVLVPWAEVDPSFPVPGMGTVAGLLAGLSDGDRGGVRLLGPWV